MLNDITQLERLRALVTPVCRAHGLDLVDARFAHEQGLVLRVLIEHPESFDGVPGVSLADCQKVSRDLSTVLDVEEDAVPSGGYRLEVGSPGIERPLVRLSDFERFRGREVHVRAVTAIDGRRRFSGTLLGVDGDAVRVTADGREFRIPHADIVKAHLVVRY
jgi:ribosome maturation factor RimP